MSAVDFIFWRPIGKLIYMLNRLRRLPLELRIALIGMLGGNMLNVVWALSQAGWKIDPGIATLFGAIIGLGIVGWQARRGFSNLIRSQAHQADLDRSARLHKAELDEAAKEKERNREARQLLASTRAEIAALYSSVLAQQKIADTQTLMSKVFQKQKLPSTLKDYTNTNLRAPVFEANISKIGLLGTDLGADVIKVLSKADGRDQSVTLDQAIPHQILAELHSARFDYLQKWGSDLLQVALRIKAAEQGSADPGSLIATEVKRYSELPKQRSYDDLLND